MNKFAHHFHRLKKKKVSVSHLLVLCVIVWSLFLNGCHSCPLPFESPLKHLVN